MKDIMKLQLLLLFCLTYSFCSGQYSFKIKGKTPDVFNGKKIYLAVWDRYSHDKYELEDSTVVKNDTFSFHGFIHKPSEEAHLYSKQPNGYFRIVVDTGLNEIYVHPLKPKTPLYKNKLSNSEVIHSKSNRIIRQIDSLANYYYLTKGKPSPVNRNLIELDEAARAALRSKKISILKNNPDTYYTLVHLYGMSASLTTAELLDVYSTLNDEIKNSTLGIEFYERLTLKKGVEIGSKAKEFTARTNTDSLFSNASLTAKPYFLAFGATWCIPCKERLPFLKQQYNKYKAKGLEVVYVNLDNKMEKWKSLISKEKLEWINVSENLEWKESKIAKLFDVNALPFYLIIDKAGKIIYNEQQLKDGDMKQLERFIVTALK